MKSDSIIALIVSSLGAFRQLYVTKNQKRLAGTRTRTKSLSFSSVFKGMLSSTRSQTQTLSIPESIYHPSTNGEDHLPLKSIRVSHDVDISKTQSKETMRTVGERDFPAWQQQLGAQSRYVESTLRLGDRIFW
jgi:hypothetical protein